MNYQEFKNFLVVHLWKQGDSVVLDNLDTIIKTAHAELNSSFKVEDRNSVKEADAISRRVQMPADYRSMVALSNPRRGGMTYVDQHRYSIEIVNYNRGEPGPYYTVSGGSIMLTGSPTPSTPFPLVMVYYNNVPDFAATDESWLAEKFFNVYLYCVLKHTAPFLREDERLAIWQGLYTDAFNLAMEENAHDVKFAGTPMKMQMRGIK